MKFIFKTIVVVFIVIVMLMLTMFFMDYMAHNNSDIGDLFKPVTREDALASKYSASIKQINIIIDLNSSVEENINKFKDNKDLEESIEIYNNICLNKYIKIDVTQSLKSSLSELRGSIRARKKACKHSYNTLMQKIYYKLKHVDE